MTAEGTGAAVTVAVAETLAMGPADSSGRHTETEAAAGADNNQP
jgi:hypothetical protein